MDDAWVILLFALAGLLVGGTVSTWKSSRVLSAALALCAALALAAGALRMAY